MNAFPWVDTPLGSPVDWPKSLHSTVRTILGSRYPMILLWGRALIQIYNDAYIGLIGAKHPGALGRSIRDTQAESWGAIGAMIEAVTTTGVPNWVPAQGLPLMRSGYLEESYFSLSYSAVDDDDGKIGGMLCVCSEVTEQVVGSRRMRLLREIGAAGEARDPKATCAHVARVLDEHVLDVPFSGFYLLDEHGALRRCGVSGLAVGDLLPERVTVPLGDDGTWPFSRVMGGETVLVEHLRDRIELPAGPFADPLKSALVMPITSNDPAAPLGAMIVGVSPARVLDETYRTFYELCSGQVSTLVRSAHAFEEERRRAEALAEVDRVKTAFFSNVSHEFRTPLTLMLGPMQDASSRVDGSLGGEELQSVYRNALRLLKLVNSLLDFSRVESGRLQAWFRPTDLGSLTAGLVGSFQSLFQTAGLELKVDCPALSEPIYVDPAQWEKIVLNLVSNAFKFTFEGGIFVSLRARGPNVELSVRDTGTGIPVAEQPRIFERFHRVEGARGRSFEGTGIGLALVQELCKQHGGSVRVESEPGRGSTFIVSIPTGVAHLPKERVGASEAEPMVSTDPSPWLLEAEHWQGADAEHVGPPSADPPSIERSSARVLIAEDNADMRAYLLRLLSPRWITEATEDGLAALEAARARPPDLVLSDVMMPRMDGVTLLRTLRADPATATIPVVLLSARAGEDSVVDGLETGADDYLVKPFSARELLSRVSTHLELSRSRRAAAAAAQELARTRAILLEEVERKNAELEAFSYSVSHDLRAPLRSIDGFSLAILEDCADKLDEDGRRHLHLVREAAQRMAQLIDDLLMLARVSRSDMERKPTDLAALAAVVCKRFRRHDPDRAVEIHVHDPLVADADPRLMEIVLENLLGNAWKFTGKRPQARIEVGSRSEDGRTVYFVRDDGAGFDMAYADKLFGAFQRLHSTREFDGTGVGLATVQRIVQRHGGRIWAEGKVGAGATFYFTLDERETIL